MDFKNNRFKEKTTHFTKDGIIGIIAPNSSPVNKFNVFNKNLHCMIFKKKNPDLKNQVKLGFSPFPKLQSNKNQNDSDLGNIKIFKERSSEEINPRSNFQKFSMKNVRSTKNKPITSLSPYKDNRYTETVPIIPFLPALNKKEISERKINCSFNFTAKTKENYEASKLNCFHSSPTTNRNKFKIAAKIEKNDDVYLKNKENKALVNSADRNIIAERESSVEFLNRSNKNNFLRKNHSNQPQDIKTLELEINKILDKLNKISNSLRIQNYR